MTAVATAIVGSSVVGAYASSRASKAQSKAAGDANELEYEQFQQTREDQTPYREAGYGGLNELMYRLGMAPSASSVESESNFDAAAYMKANPDVAKDKQFKGDAYGHYMAYGKGEGRKFTPTAAASNTLARYGNTKSPEFGSLLRQFTGKDLAQEPGYQFGLQQGQTAVDRSAASRGGLFSGATLKALNKFGNDYAGTKFNDAFNRDQATKGQTFNMLSGISGTGQVANQQVQQAGQTYATNAGNNLLGAGNARASGYVGAANALTSGVGQYMNYNQNQNLLKMYGG